MYNLKDDIGEQVNLVNSNPEKAIELKAKLLEMQKETGAQFPFENIDNK